MFRAESINWLPQHKTMRGLGVSGEPGWIQELSEIGLRATAPHPRDSKQQTRARSAEHRLFSCHLAS